MSAVAPTLCLTFNIIIITITIIIVMIIINVWPDNDDDGDDDNDKPSVYRSMVEMEATSENAHFKSVSSRSDCFFRGHGFRSLTQLFEIVICLVSFHIWKYSNTNINRQHLSNCVLNKYFATQH